jgi:hypothetical protein
MRIAALLLALLIARVGAAQETFALSGTLNGPDGPLPGIAITVEARHEHNQNMLLETSVTTDATGSFRVNVPRSNVTLRGVTPPESHLDFIFLPAFLVQRDTSVRLKTERLVTLSGDITGGTGGTRFDIYSLTTNRTYGAFVQQDGHFETQVPRDVYSIHAQAAQSSLMASHTVDATAGGQSGIRIDLRPVTEFRPVPASAPRASLISVSVPDDDGGVTVTGAAGSVEPRSAILVNNVATGHINMTVSAADGSFSAPLFALPGSPIAIRHDPSGRYLPWLTIGGPAFQPNAAPATLIRVPMTAGEFSASGSIDFFASGAGDSRSVSVYRSIGWIDPGIWQVRGSFSGGTMNPGAPLQITGQLRIYARDVTTSEAVAALSVNSSLNLAPVIDKDGLQQRQTNDFVSTSMTPSGLPIERNTGFIAGNICRTEGLGLIRPGVVEGQWSCSAAVPQEAPPGLYRLVVNLNVGGMPPRTPRFDGFPLMGQPSPFQGGLAPVRVGNTPLRLAWTLAMDEFSNGMRGIVAVEDRGKVAVSSKVMTSTDTFVLPLRDDRTGQPSRLRLEPYLPLLSVTPGNGGTPEPPHVAFRFPSGGLTATVRKPDGSQDVIGPVPFAQLAFATPVTRGGTSATAASNHPNDFHRLTTLDPRFDYAFTQWGRHEVTLSGTVEDIHGNVYEGRGTYEIDVARHLDLDTAALPGTPFLPGDSVNTGVTIHPGQPAAVWVKVRLYPDSMVERVQTFDIRGTANRFGHFTGEPVTLGAAGEYRIDVRASYVDPAGVPWVGAATWGGIVETPQSSLVTRGRRGFDGVNRIQQQWLFVKESRAGGDHLMFPFSSGDVMWMSKDDPAADIPKITVQDQPGGAFAARVRSRANRPGASWEDLSIDERITLGEIPLFSTRNASNAVEQWGYFYAAVSRPGVRVREFISEDQSGSGYWRFNDRYNLQLGTGLNGDLPNDFKFQFGGAVYRDLTDGFRYYGGYASLFVLLPMNDPIGGRIFPPFQGNGGGASGGPLFRLKGKDVDLFLHLTGVRPGTILHTFETASFAGYVAPTLAGNVEIVVTSPSGMQRTLRGTAGKYGFFYDPKLDFRVGEPGVWRARVKVTFEGRVPSTSGQVTAPFPSGGVLGSREGEFNFYVADARSDPPGIAPLPPFVRPPEPMAITVVPPPGLSSVQLTYTATIPGFILEEGTSTALSYVYDAARLAADFPNLDLYDQDGFAAADTVTVSLLVSGTDASGARKHFTRQVVFQGEEVQITDQKARGPAHRRSTLR